jgi:hypothetical protein
MGRNNFRHDVELPGGSATPPASEPSWPTLVARLRVRFLAARLDRDLEAGILPEPGSALVLHMARVTSVEERQALARSLRHVVSDPCDTSRVVPIRVPFHAQRVAACWPRSRSRKQHRGAGDAPLDEVGERPVGLLQRVLRTGHLDAVPAGEGEEFAGVGAGVR